LNSEVDQTVGAYAYSFLMTPPLALSGLREHLNYQEQSLRFTANQLVGKHWSLGARYCLSQAVLNGNFVDVTNSPLGTGSIDPKQRLKGVLNQVDLVAVYNHPCGFFARPEAHWYGQSNSGYDPGEPGDYFWQLNAFVGYRFPRRKAEVAFGFLNLTDQDYNLNPLNLHNELPRSRTFALRAQFSF
jgi:hypothetical protein